MSRLLIVSRQARLALRSSRVFATTTATRKKKEVAAIDGNTAAVHIAYAMSEVAFIYPISPATSMGEKMDEKAAMDIKNAINGQVCKVEVMQSEGGAAGAVHGALTAGAMSSTFTASQGLLLMIPNLYLIAGELMPAVFHVAARTVSKHALSIFNDHSDVMACRQCGWAMLCSNSTQEVMDLALVAHLATLNSRVPFMHFFDGYRTSAGVQKVELIDYDDIAKLVPRDKIQTNLRDLALTPEAPIARGTGQRPDIFFQATVAAHPFYEATPQIVKDAMKTVGDLTGRYYDLFQYSGDPNAERIIIQMGSGCQTTEQTVNAMVARGEKVGLVKVHLFRPWSAKDFLKVVPDSAKKICVLDRTREDGALASPLHLDVSVSFSDAQDLRSIVGGQYGLASKEYTPMEVEAVFENLNQKEPKKRFVVGIDDDVSHTSLPLIPVEDSIPAGTKQCIVWGFGSDGTVGANKEAVKTISEKTSLFSQGHFAHDSHKAGGVTISHLRFGPEPIQAEYEIQQADYIACHHPVFVKTLDVIEKARKGSVFVLNSTWTTMDKMERELPAAMKRKIHSLGLKFYNIDATTLARDLGLGPRINMIMQAAFYKLSDVLSVAEAIPLLKQSIIDVYGSKGKKIVKSNHDAVDAALPKLVEIIVPPSWATAVDAEKAATDEPDFVSKIMHPVVALKGDILPVSAFTPGGMMPVGTTKYEKRGVAPAIPIWLPDACTQCNYCAIVCPHAVIRPFLLDKKEKDAAPAEFLTRKAKGGAEVAGLNYSIVVSAMDCTGCEVCVEACPDDALVMVDFGDVAHKKSPDWDYAIRLNYLDHADRVTKTTVKGSQFQQPLLEFHGACAGCGETPYVALATRLFGERMQIANASGCSSVWGGTSTTHPYSTHARSGRGPAWGRSLFEDNAEYGYGMVMAAKQRREHTMQLLQQAGSRDDVSGELKSAFTRLLKTTDGDKSLVATDAINTILGTEKDGNPFLEDVWKQRSQFPVQSPWLIGGDGWAYDIGQAGLDHVMSRGENLNILILDTEMYSNTGGQISKSTPMAAVTKFALKGNRRQKKDLGLQAMAYGDVYVASIAMGADYNQSLKAFREAEDYNGTSVILALSPCIDWGMDMKNMMSVQKTAVDSGYWNLYRFDPRLDVPFQLDSKKLKGKMSEWLDATNRFRKLARSNVELAAELHGKMQADALKKQETLRRLSMSDEDLLDHLKKQIGEQTSSNKVLILYGSETGTAEYVAASVAHDLKRRDVKSKCMAMDDYDFDDLPEETSVIFIAATCGQGEYPANMSDFMKQIKSEDLPSDFLANVQFSVFAMGDSHYVHYNSAGLDLDKRLSELGAQRVKSTGLGDDQDEDKYETVLEDWSPDLYNEMGMKEPEKKLLPANYQIVLDSSETPETYVPEGAKPVELEFTELLTPESYDRDIRHYEFNLKDSGISFELGDTLGVYPHNNETNVGEFLEKYGIAPDTVISLEYMSDGKNTLPSALTALHLFTEVLDIFGKPKRRFFEMLALTSENAEERAQLEHLITKEGKDELRQFTGESLTCADILMKFPSSRPGIEYLIDYIPPIKPRLYSIASSPRMHPDKLQLLIIRDDWKTPSGVQKSGLCSTYLTNVPMPGSVYGKINPAAVPMPEDHSAPVILAGLGTGLAPLRAFAQDRVYAKSQGEAVGEMSLFFGARTRSAEWSYGSEFEEYNAQGTLTNIRCAWSRDQKEKIYIQDKIREDPELIYNTLIKNNGLFYYCGTGGKAPDMVREAVVDSITTVGKMSKEEADKIITDMQINGRYNVESW
uniref:pyruvate dehydrogenase (NADP(+)) n=3 Tax=Hirondellea gigas TaxID=1518452 RepID=A0A6A7FYI8_9CRUS